MTCTRLPVKSTAYNPVRGYLKNGQKARAAKGATLASATTRDVCLQGDHAFNDLSFPVAERILWAGEATSPPFFGYTHGALLSGRREAERLIFEYELLPAYVGSGNAAAVNGVRTPAG